MRGGTVLVVDDSEIVRTIYRGVLESRAGVRLHVLEAAHGGEALAMTAAETVSLIFLDWRMPVMDGPTFLRHFRAAGGGPPVIVVTSEDDPEVRRVAFGLGAAGFSLKPIASAELWSHVEPVLRPTP